MSSIRSALLKTAYGELALKSADGGRDACEPPAQLDLVRMTHTEGVT
ncbi:hypothetical protein ACWGF2_10595 [Streptomyces sp. NPDC054919]